MVMAPRPSAPELTDRAGTVDPETAIVSDPHLSAGYNPRTRGYDRNEDFFYDTAFSRFVGRLRKRAASCWSGTTPPGGRGRRRRQRPPRDPARKDAATRVAGLFTLAFS